MKKILLLFIITITYQLSYSQDNQPHIVADKITVENPSESYPGLRIESHYANAGQYGTSPLISLNASDGSFTNKTPLTSGKQLGTLVFSGWSGSSWHQAARIQVDAKSNFSTNQFAKMNFKVGENYSGGLVRMSIDGETGNIGIGTTSPFEKLHMTNGAMQFSNLGGNDEVDIIKIAEGTVYNEFSLIGMFNGTGGDGNAIKFRSQWEDNIMYIGGDGKVGIGTDDVGQNNGDSKLIIDGKILCEEVEVIADVIPDYVFQKYYTGTSTLKADYVMPTLEEVEAFTKENHHLPEVPSASKIKEEGMQLKEMTTLLLQKVEELTLYTIEQEKRIKSLEAKLADKP